MAIAFRSAGTVLKADVSATGGSQSIALPPGHTAGDLLILYLMWDCNANPFIPGANWKLLFQASAGTSTNTPFAARPHLAVAYQIDNGSLASTNALTFNTSPWPTGSPYVLGVMVAYSGCDQTGPIGQWVTHANSATAAAITHPQITTTLANDWLVTGRFISSDPPGASFTNSVGTDAERVDDTTTFPINALAFGIYDSATALSTGLQPARTTTASRAGTYGSIETTFALRPAVVPTNVIAQADVASAVGTAGDAQAAAVPLPWDLCGALPVYDFSIDWAGDGSFTTPGDDVTADILSGGVDIGYGRDQSRQLNQAKVGSSSFSVNNTTRKYSPDWSGSVLFGNLDPSREMTGSVTFEGQSYALGFSRIDDYTLHADIDNRTVDFTFLDGLNLLNGFTLSTEVLESMRTGTLINYILDQMGWTGPRDIDPGATIVPFWWVEGVTAFAAVQDLVKSEGPPSVAYVALDGTFVFRDRHHRLLRPQSTDAQVIFAQKEIDCAAPLVTGYHFTAPFTYEHGAKNIINSVSFAVEERAATPGLAAVWTSTDTISLALGQGMQITASGSDPFINAVTPVLGTDYTTSGTGVLQVVLNRTSGQTATLSLLAVGGPVIVTGLQLRAQAIPVISTTQIMQQDTASITAHGQFGYSDTVPWADAGDAYAVASVILLHYAERSPTVQLRVVAEDAQHFAQILQRQISDRIHITNGETGTDDDFFIETISHQIDRMNQPDHAPVHAVIFGCEKDLDHGVVANPFRFDVRGAGFDQGVFDPIASDNPNTVFIFDDATNGVFDFGQFGT